MQKHIVTKMGVYRHADQSLSGILQKSLYYAEFFWAGMAFLLLSLIPSSIAFAQTTHYVDPLFGAGDTCTLEAPCTLGRAYELQSENDTLLIRVLRAGGTAELQTPASPSSVEVPVIFGAYVEGDATATEGNLEFTGANAFVIGSDGQVRLHEDARIQFKDVTVEVDVSRNIQFFLTENGAEERIVITGTLTINGPWVELGKLVVSRNLTLEGSPLTVQELVVNHGATLTLKQRIYVPLKRG